MSQPFVTSAPVAVRAGAVCPLPPEINSAEMDFKRRDETEAAESKNPSTARMTVSRRTALKQIALGTAAFSLGLQRCPAPTGPVQNNNLGLFLDITLNGTPIVTIPA